MKWFCAQIGAREHYAVPRALHGAGKLRVLFTDFWAGAMIRGCGRAAGSARLRALGQRWHPELASAVVRDFGFRAIGWELGLRRRAREGRLYEGYLDVGAAFGRRTAERLVKEVGAGDVVFAYDTGALEILAASRSAGALGVVDQMDPGRVEEQLVRNERERWSGWEPPGSPIPEEFHARREQEWAAANRVVVNSEFCRKALNEQGVPAAKIAVVPLAYDPPSPRLRRTGRSEKENPPSLRVLFFGQVILRKGIQYLVEAAKLLSDENVEFDVVGPIGIAAEAVRAAPANMRFHGPVTRGEAAEWYARSDVFVLPTISDGFGLTQLEAMAHGLPVIATRNCGEVVEPERSGTIVPAGDPAALATAILRFVHDRAYWEACATGAAGRVRNFSIEALRSRLDRLEPGDG